MSNKEWMIKYFNIVVLVILCFIIVDITQTTAVCILAGFHEMGHAIVGVLNGEQLACIPSVNINMPIPMGVGGLTRFTDSSKGTWMRVIAGPMVSLAIGILLTILFINHRNITTKIESHKKKSFKGYIIEFFTILLFWSGFTIAKEFYNKNPSSDLGGAQLTLLGQIIFFLIALFGLMIMSTLFVERCIQVLKICTVYEDHIKLYKKKVLSNLAFLLFDTLLMILLPIEIVAICFGILYMLFTNVLYILLLKDGYDIAKIGKELAF